MKTKYCNNYLYKRRLWMMWTIFSQFKKRISSWTNYATCKPKIRWGWKWLSLKNRTEGRKGDTKLLHFIMQSFYNIWLQLDASIPWTPKNQITKWRKCKLFRNTHYLAQNMSSVFCFKCLLNSCIKNTQRFSHLVNGRMLP